MGTIGKKIRILISCHKESDAVTNDILRPIPVGSDPSNKKTKPTFDLKPAFPENNVVVALSANEHYVPYVAVLLESIRQHISCNHNYDFIIMTKDIAPKSQKLLKELFTDDTNVSVSFIDVSEYEEFFKNVFLHGHFVLETWFRLLMPELLSNYDKVLYLDSDMVVNADIAELFDTDIEGYLLAACRDPDTAGLYNGYQKDKKEYMDKVLKLKDPYSYFQAGVILMNLKAFRQRFSTKEILDYATSEKFQLLDQDVLNKLCEGSVHYVDMSWNVMVDFNGIRRNSIIALAPDYLRNAYDVAHRNPKIIHYAGPQKPWYYPKMDFAEAFWAVARQMPFYEELLYDMSQHSAKEIHTWYKAKEKHPVRDAVEIIRLNSLKLWPEDSASRIAIRNFVKRKILRKDDTNQPKVEWMPEIPEAFKDT